MFTEHLISLAEKYCHREGCSKKALGARIVNNSNLFPSLEEGQTCTLKTFERALDFFTSEGLIAHPLEGLTVFDAASPSAGGPPFKLGLESSGSSGP